MTVGGVTWAYNAISQDYCLYECVQALKECCDSVVVLDAGSTDGTAELIKSFQDEKTDIVLCENILWQSKQGREKLSFFQNLAASFLKTDYQLVIQADEILHERSYPFIKEAIESGGEAFILERINLWASPYLQLDVPQERKPCSTGVVRLAKVNYQSYDDAEQIAAQFSDKYFDKLCVYHMGFVRHRPQMKIKSIHMQKEVFQFGDYDSKIDLSDTFNPYLWFGDEDLKPIKEPLPKVIQKWAEERVY
jgi:glycosyltransferase involved in cell wall biosynthesis